MLIGLHNPNPVGDCFWIVIITHVRQCLTSTDTNKVFRQGGSPGLVVMEGDSSSVGHGFKSQHRILDGHFFSFICCKDFSVYLIKRGRGWSIFKNKVVRPNHKFTNYLKVCRSINKICILKSIQ